MSRVKGVDVEELVADLSRGELNIEDLHIKEVAALVTHRNLTSEQVTALIARKDLTSEQVTALIARKDLTGKQIARLQARTDLNSKQIARLEAREDLNDEKVAALVTRKDLTSEEVVGVVARNNLTSEQVTGLVARNNLTSEQVAGLVTSNDLTSEQAAKLLTKNNKTEPEPPKPPFQLNLRSYDKTDGSSRQEHTVMISENDKFTEETIKTAKLSTVRALLMKKGALSLTGKVRYFCNVSGARVADDVLFSEYLDIVAQGPTDPPPEKQPGKDEKQAEKKKEKKKEKKEGKMEGKMEEKGDGDEDETPVISTVATVIPVTADTPTKGYTVYLQNKKSEKNVLDKEVLKLLDKELDLDLKKNRPELLKRLGITHLQSNYDHSKFMATSGGEKVSPTDLTEKQWDSIIRNNALLNGYRLAFTYAGSEVGGKSTQLRFRRIERAPYTAFVLKTRLFAPYEISDQFVMPAESSDQDVDLGLPFRIPRFVVEDESYVNVFETQTSMETSFAESSFSQTELQGSFGGGAFGVTAAVSGGSSKNETAALVKEGSTQKKMMNISYNFPQVVLHLDSYSLELTQDCAAHLKRVRDTKSVTELLAFNQKYGHFYASRVELGGRLYASESYDLLGAKSEAEAASALKIAAGLSFSSTRATGGGNFSQEDQQRKAESEENKSLQASFTWQAQGGNTLLCNNPQAWIPTVAPLQNWRVIKQEDVMPLAELIGKIPGYETVPNELRMITAGSRQKVIVNIKFGVALEQRKNKDQPEYLTLDLTEYSHDTAVNGLYEKYSHTYLQEYYKTREPPMDLQVAMSSVSSPMFSLPPEVVRMQNVSAAIEKDIKNVKPKIMEQLKDFKGRLRPAPVTEHTQFQVHVETFLNQAPALQFNQKYKLYCTKAERFLRAVVVHHEDFRYTLLGYGTEEEATDFHFQSSQAKSGNISKGDEGSVFAYAPDGRNMGPLSYPPVGDPESYTSGQTSEVTHELWRSFTFEIE